MCFLSFTICGFFLMWFVCEDLKVQLSPFPLLDYLKLSFLSGGRFVAALDDFLRPQLRKGVVSLFAALRRLYTRERAHLIGTVLESYVEHLQRSPSSFGPLLGERREKRQDEPHCSNTSDSSNACCGNSKNSEGLIQNNSLNCSQESGEKPEIATALLYAYMLMAQHYDFMGNTEKALQTIQKVRQQQNSSNSVKYRKTICSHRHGKR